MQTESLIYLSTIFLFIAILYSMVGFGGGSSYLAILTFYMADQYIIRSNALLCNIAVVSIGTLTAIIDKSLPIKRALIYTLLSVPAAYFGAMLRLNDRTFFILLSLALLVSAFGMLVQTIINSEAAKVENNNFLKPLTLGGIIGFFSGMVGIGGGIFLSPIAHLLKMESAKHMAAIASFFILVNSVSGLFGLVSSGSFSFEPSISFILIGVVVLGGILGSRLKSKKLKANHIRLLTALLVFVVGLRLFIKYI